MSASKNHKPYASTALVVMMLAAWMYGAGLALAQESKSAPSINQNWASGIRERRKQAESALDKARKMAVTKTPPGNKAPQTTPTAQTPQGNSTVKDKEGTTAVIDGRRIRISSKVKTTPTPTPTPTVEVIGSLEAANLVAAPTTVAAATATPTFTFEPTSTPVIIKVRKPKMMNGSIVYIEIEMTATPGPTNTATPLISSATVVSGSAAASIVPATGILREVYDKLSEAVKSASSTVKFTPKQIAKIREEVITRTTRQKEKALAIMSATETRQLQTKVSRLSGVSKETRIDAKTAADILRLLFPNAGKAEIAAKNGNGEDKEGEAEEDDLFLVEEGADSEEGEEAEVYYDPDSNSYVYPDGTVVPAQPVQQPQYQPPPPPPPQEFVEPPPPPPPNEGEVNGEEFIEDTQDFVDEGEIIDEGEFIEEPDIQDDFVEEPQDDYVEEDLEYQEEDFSDIEEDLGGDESGDFIEGEF